MIALLVLVPVIRALVSPSSAIAGVQTFGTPTGGHSEQPQNYPQSPPVGGVHSTTWQNCTTYTQPVQPEAAVHSLEHGAVWIAYRPDLPPATVTKLLGVVGGRRSVLLSPYPGLSAPVVASAWGAQLSLDDSADSRLAQFISAYAQGPQTHEPGAACTGGTSTTVAP